MVHCHSLLSFVVHYSFVWRPPKLDHLSKRQPTLAKGQFTATRRHVHHLCSLLLGTYYSHTTFYSLKYHRTTFIVVVGPSSLYFDPQNFISVKFKATLEEKLQGFLLFYSLTSFSLEMATGSVILFFGSPSIASEKLNEKYYLSWSTAVEMWFICQRHHDHLEQDGSDVSVEKVDQ